MKAKDMLLQDALETAIETEKKCIVYRRIIAGMIIGVVLWIAKHS